jgi:hypothetical protein
MNEFTKQDLQDYIQYRRNALKELLSIGVIPGIVDSIERYKMQGILEEFDAIEEWFDE